MTARTVNAARPIDDPLPWRVDAFSQLLKVVPSENGETEDPLELRRVVVIAFKALNGLSPMGSVPSREELAKYRNYSTREFLEKLRRARSALKALQEFGPLFFHFEGYTDEDAEEEYGEQLFLLNDIQTLSGELEKQVKTTSKRTKASPRVQDLQMHLALAAAKAQLLIYEARYGLSRAQSLGILEAIWFDIGLPDRSSDGETMCDWLRKYMKRHNLLGK